MPDLEIGGLERWLAWGAIYGIAVILGTYWVALGLTVRRLQRKRPQARTYPPVSILIATHRRGEIHQLLPQLKLLWYEAPWEVVVVLDRLPPEEERRVSESLRQLGIAGKVVQVSETPTGWSPKKYALVRGLEKVRYEWVVVLDADVRIEGDYLRKLMSRAEGNATAVVGIGWLEGRGIGSASFSAWEAALIQIESVGRAAWGYPYMATGRGWAIRKSWLQQGLYLWREVVSGDDDLTLQLIPRQWVRASGAATISEAPATWQAHFRRKGRHLQTGKHYTWKILLTLSLERIGYAGLWGAALINGDFWGAVLLVWMARWVAVYTNGAPLRRWAFLWDPLLLLLQGVYALGSLRRTKQW